MGTREPELCLSSDSASRRIYVELLGKVTLPMLLLTAERVAGETIVPEMVLVADLRAAELAIESAEMRVLADSVRAITSRTGAMVSKTAVVASQDFMFGMTRMYELLMEERNIRIFRELDPALEWAGIEADLLDRLRKAAKRIPLES
jgi:hypothetical protein